MIIDILTKKFMWVKLISGLVVRFVDMYIAHLGFIFVRINISNFECIGRN
jgi:hypothetical protein